MRTEKKILRCPVCETIVELLDAVGPEIVCCGPPMEEVAESVVSDAGDPHCPIVQRDARGGVTVQVGLPIHVMRQDHHIQWIEALAGGLVCRQYFSPGQPPRATFPVAGEELVVRGYCSGHGLWTSGPIQVRPARSLGAAVV